VQARVEFWDAGRALMTKGLGILRFPLEEKTSEDGKTTIKPAKWTTKDAATLMRVGKELMCIASDIANEKIDVNIPAELKRIAEEHGIPAEEAQQIYDGVMSEVKAAKAGSKEIN